MSNTPPNPSAGLGTHENRSNERAPLEVEVSLESENNFYAGITGNVSTGGVFIATYTPPPAGAEVSLELKLAGSAESFHVRGMVCWSRSPERSSEFAPPGVGIRWIDLPPAVETAIKRFVDKRDTILFDDD
jgi:uncharacterized protein (TIGR02266 family)